jgi:monoamine oxidase
MRNIDNHILIIGAGAAGLMAARELSMRGFEITILEANDRAGGRINTVLDSAFDIPLETGAEFIHGNLIETINLLNEAGIKFNAVKGKHYQVNQGQWKLLHEAIEGWDELMQQIKKLTKDMIVADFLKKYFGDEKHALLRNTIRQYVEGYDTADIHTASMLALRNEWINEEDDQYRVEGGYYQLIQYLIRECSRNNCAIHLSSIVKKIEWSENNVNVYTQNGEVFKGYKVIITVPISVLQSEENAIAAITFIPAINQYINAAKDIGYGAVIKILLQFKEPFWNEKSNDLSFILSSQTIPTWWTQFPSKSNLLTGWLGGPNAKALRSADPHIVLKLALESLSVIFSIDIPELKDYLIAWKVEDWGADNFSMGAYSFATIKSEAARKLLNTPLLQTLFFAGEGLYEGENPGTVEAALVSGKNAAHLI